MKLDIPKDLLQKNIPTNAWLVKDTNLAVIRQVSTDVVDPENLSEAEELCMQKLIDFTRYSQDKELNDVEQEDHLRPAVGLAAPQIGMNKNMFFVRFEWDEENEQIEEFAIINGKIISASEQIIALQDGEGCLSVDDDQPGIVPRAFKIVVEGYDYLTKEYVTLTLRNYAAIVFQHELDHNKAVLYYDHINKAEPMFTKEDWILI